MDYGPEKKVQQVIVDMYPQYHSFRVIFFYFLYEIPMHVHLTEDNLHYHYALSEEENEGINFFSFIRGLIDQSYPPMALALNPYRHPKRDTQIRTDRSAGQRNKLCQERHAYSSSSSASSLTTL